MTDVTFNGITLSSAVPSAIVTQVNRGLLGPRRDVYTEVPGRAGSWMFPDQPGDRIVAVSLHILETSYPLRRAAVIALATWADSTGLAKLVVDDEPTRYWDAKLTGPGDPNEWLLSAEITLEFRTGPYAKQSTTSTEGPWTVPPGTHTFTVPGDVPVQAVAEITAGAAITVTHLVTNGADLVWSGGLASGGKITVNGICYMVTTGPNTDTELVGYFNPALASMAGVGGTFPVLNPGSNTIQLITTPAGAAATVAVSWRRQFRG